LTTEHVEVSPTPDEAGTDATSACDGIVVNMPRLMPMEKAAAPRAKNELILIMMDSP
jgi:hypothetical protein